MKVLLTGANGYTGRRLLLYAEMRLPGEVWCSSGFFSDEDGGKPKLEQLAAFRPKGLPGRFTGTRCCHFTTLFSEAWHATWHWG